MVKPNIDYKSKLVKKTSYPTTMYIAPCSDTSCLAELSSFQPEHNPLEHDYDFIYGANSVDSVMPIPVEVMIPQMQRIIICLGLIWKFSSPV